ncbi:hypothetical protein L6452_15937 [Arctium lappa]|uniref:Uncharacterized protein n=1 Tax=Arctium lappa TaxID=4217 RepID=A0ACB9CQE9_ARCLA|nr:hypothetical protein L6452_15937 [Arctium lappa]
MGQRYLIVIDDIWSIKAWDDMKLEVKFCSQVASMKLLCMQNRTGSSTPCLILTDKQSRELLRKKVFHGDECPEWVIEPGMQIAKKCQGLPLSVVVMAGVLAKEAVLNCLSLEEIPVDIGDIATLELFETHSMLNDSVVESIKRIQKEQCDEGNNDLKIIVDGLELSIYLSAQLSSYSSASDIDIGRPRKRYLPARF